MTDIGVSQLEMNNSREAFVRLLEYMLNRLDIRKVHASTRRPFKRKGPVSVSTEHRFDVVLTGVKHMTFAADGEIQDVMMKPGEVHYSPPNAWKWPLWDSLHEMSSIIYGLDYVRITYINYDRHSEYFKTHGALIFYITSGDIGPAGQHLLAAMADIAENKRGAELHHLFVPLAQLTLECLKQEKDIRRPSYCAQNTWHQLLEYVNNNFYYPINRDQVAAEFGLSPSYVSRLFAAKGEAGFNETLRRLRMERAVRMLTDSSDMNIEEITRQCGYLSKTFFISAFKQHYGITPGQFRKKQFLKNRAAEPGH